MPSSVRTGALIALMLVIGACAPGRAGAVPSSSAGPTATAAASTSTVATAEPTLMPPSPTSTPTAAPSAATVPTMFTSTIYGYSLTLPAGWTAIHATSAWDGTSALSHDAVESDQFIESYPRSAWVNAAPTKGGLSDVVKQT